MPEAVRRCGECSLCCTVMGVADLEPVKPPAVACDHVCAGGGCQIYAARPRSCREFVCLWAQGSFPEEFRPDKVGIVFCTDPGDERLIGYYDPERPEEWKVMLAGLKATSLFDVTIIVGPSGQQPLFMFKDGQVHNRPAGV